MILLLFALIFSTFLNFILFSNVLSGHFLRILPHPVPDERETADSDSQAQPHKPQEEKVGRIKNIEEPLGKAPAPLSLLSIIKAQNHDSRRRNSQTGDERVSQGRQRRHLQRIRHPVQKAEQQGRNAKGNRLLSFISGRPVKQDRINGRKQGPVAEQSDEHQQNHQAA